MVRPLQIKVGFPEINPLIPIRPLVNYTRILKMIFRQFVCGQCYFARKDPIMKSGLFLMNASFENKDEKPLKDVLLVAAFRALCIVCAFRCIIAFIGVVVILMAIKSRWRNGGLSGSSRFRFCFTNLLGIPKITTSFFAIRI
jgi:hypothetical protein